MLNALRSRYRQSLEKKTASLDPQTRADLARDVHDSTLDGVDELREVDASIEQAQHSLQELEEKKKFIGVRLVAYREQLDLAAKTLHREEERLTGNASGENIKTNWNELQEETEPLAGSQFNVEDGRLVGVITRVDDVESENDVDLNESKKEIHSSSLSLTMEELVDKQLQLKRDQATLGRVEKSRHEMECNARELQKRIFVLERKRDELLSKIGEGRDFVVAAANVEEQEAEDDDTVDSEDDLEQGHAAQRDGLNEDEMNVLNG